MIVSSVVDFLLSWTCVRMYLLTRRGGQAAAGEWRLEAAGVPDVPEAHGSARRAGDGAARQLCHHGCLRPVGQVHMAVAATTVTIMSVYSNAERTVLVLFLSYSDSCYQINCTIDSSILLKAIRSGRLLLRIFLRTW